MYDNWRFEKWVTPISSMRTVILESLQDGSDGLTVIVETDEKPEVDIRVSFYFAKAPAYRNIQESYRTELWAKLGREMPGTPWSSLRVFGADWAEALRQEPLFPEIKHFMISTVDDVIEVLTPDEPAVTVLGPGTREPADQPI